MSAWLAESLVSQSPWALRLRAYMAEVLNLGRSPVALPKRMTRPNSAQAGDALGGVLAGQAVEGGVHALAIGELGDACFVVVELVVDAVVESEFGVSLSSFSGLEAVPKISKPRMWPSCTAAVPTPPAAAWMSTRGRAFWRAAAGSMDSASSPAFQ